MPEKKENFPEFEEKLNKYHNLDDMWERHKDWLREEYPDLSEEEHKDLLKATKTYLDIQYIRYEIWKITGIREEYI